MKTFFNALAGTIIAILFALGLAILVKPSVFEDKTLTTSLDVVDSLVEKAVTNYTNPEFSEPQEVLEFTSDIKANKKIDSLILSLPETTLYNIVSVCKKKYGTFTLKTLYDEYFENKDVYNGLPTKPIQVTDKSPSQEEPNSTKNKEQIVSTTYKDTIIEGKKYILETKLSKQNE